LEVRPVCHRWSTAVFVFSVLFPRGIGGAFLCVLKYKAVIIQTQGHTAGCCWLVLRFLKNGVVLYACAVCL
jgi:hypothetical protein